MLCLAACAVPVYERSPELLGDADDPVLEENTDAGLHKLALEQKRALDKCTAEKRALRNTLLPR